MTHRHTDHCCNDCGGHRRGTCEGCDRRYRNAERRAARRRAREAIAPGQPTDRRPVKPAPCACFANAAPCRGESTATVVATGQRVCDRHALELEHRVRVTWDAWC